MHLQFLTILWQQAGHSSLFKPAATFEIPKWRNR